MGRTARAGREGRAVSLVTPQDVGLVRAIEEHTGAKMTELELDDSRVAEILVQVNTARREADLQLGEQDWGLARETNKRKKVILQGKIRRRGDGRSRRRNSRHRRKPKRWRSNREYF